MHPIMKALRGHMSAEQREAYDRLRKVNARRAPEGLDSDVRGDLDADGFPIPDYKKLFSDLEDLTLSFYRRATSLGVHAFIEHTGVMREHLKILQAAQAAGIAIENINVHGSVGYPMAPHNALYLAEKLSCIFAPFFTEETFGLFVKAMKKEIKSKAAGAPSARSPRRSPRPKASRPSA